MQMKNLYLLIIIIIFYISLGFSKIQEKVTTLIQENAILSKKVNDLEKKIEENRNDKNN